MLHGPARRNQRNRVLVIAPFVGARLVTVYALAPALGCGALRRMRYEFGGIFQCWIRGGNADDIVIRR
jgi:hypothetical protein